MKSVHIFSLIFAALLLHTISKEYVTSLSSSRPRFQTTYQPTRPTPRVFDRPSPHHDPYPTTLPIDVQRQNNHPPLQTVPQPTEYDVGGAWIGSHDEDGGEYTGYTETILDSQDHFKDVITS